MLNGYPVAASGLEYVSVSIASLSAGQAAGTTAILPAKARRALKIVPPVDCTLTLAADQTAGIPLYGGVSNELTGGDCPTNQLFVRGLSAGATLTLWEA